MSGVAVAAPEGDAAAPETAAQAAPKELFLEDFENGADATPVMLDAYTGKDGTTYTAEAGWMTGCNGSIIQFDSPASAGGAAGCGSTSWPPVRRLPHALGQVAGTAPTTNHAVTAYTENDPGADNVQFATADPIALDVSKRFLTFGVDAAAMNCGVSGPLFKFSIIDGSISTPVGEIDPCTDPAAQTYSVPPPPGASGNMNVLAGTFTAKSSILFSGSDVGIEMVNGNGSGRGNDAAFDNIRILDVTPQLSKDFSPASTAAGKNSTMTFTITNTDELGSKNGWEFKDALPSGLTLAGAATTDCSGGTVTGGEGDTEISVKGNLDEGQESCKVTAPVTTDEAGTYTNKGSGVDTTGLDSPSDADVEFTPSADLVAEKEATTTEPVSPGETFEYKVTAENKGPSEAEDVKVEDTLPDGLTFVSSSDGCTASGQDVTCGPEATLASGAKKEWVFKVKLDPDYTGDGSDLQNTATASSSTDDPDPDNNESDPADPPGGKIDDPKADLSSDKTVVTPGPVSPGGKVEYQVTVKNAGPSTAKNVRATDTLPAGLEFASSDDCTASGQDLVCGPEDSLAPGDKVAFTYTVKVADDYKGDGSDLGNKATSGSDTDDPNPGNDTSDPVYPPMGQADLAITKKADVSGKVRPGEPYDYVITVRNDGPDDAHHVEVTDSLPGPVGFISSSDGCTANGQLVTCPMEDELAAGKSKTYRITVMVRPGYEGNGSDIDNRASVDGGSYDPDEGNNTSPSGGAPIVVDPCDKDKGCK
ncbi:COG1361 S-layer family protein [Streptomyces boninensis]|uniref:COG1361 S-layer family protein n=1 Tax=Streptomyces boninensis TaxID=2039455 RepID=UPI003B20EAF2